MAVACGSPFELSGLVTALTVFLIAKPLGYYAFIQAFRYRVIGRTPMTHGRAAKLAGIRAALGLIPAFGVALILTMESESVPSVFFFAFLFLLGTRLAIWWNIGHQNGDLLIRDALVGWTAAGTALNLAIDASIIAAVANAWWWFAGIAGVAAMFLLLLHSSGHRTALRLQYSNVPYCRKCQYNLTGNVSGICSECGTPVAGTSSSAAPCPMPARCRSASPPAGAM
ncbi:MAG: hypothetical protein O7D94_06135, partial [Planctomycetota bacterium]|nr:hypothetical protein [Planctomycetota bacterium]